MTEVNRFSPNLQQSGFATAEQRVVAQQEQQISNREEQRVSDDQRIETVRENTQTREQDNLNSEAARQEQRQRERELQTERLEGTSQPQITPPNQDTIRQLEQNATRQQEQSQNASGLGQTAINSYNSLSSQQQNELLRGQVNVDITA